MRNQRFPSGSITIHNARIGMDQLAKIGQSRVTGERIIIDPFLFPDSLQPYSFEARTAVGGGYEGTWKCRDGRSGPLKNCKFDSDRLTIAGTMVEYAFDHGFMIELDEED